MVNRGGAEDEQTHQALHRLAGEAQAEALFYIAGMAASGATADRWREEL